MTDWLNELLPEGTPSGQARAVTGDEDLTTVGAGAGTGKTWVLSTRFARLLFDGREGEEKCLPQNILTLTFTEAAAREMQERIKKRSFELIEHQENPASWQAVKDGFDETWISTIHSFASRMIRESGLSLDIDPQSGVVSAPQEEAFWGSLERALETLDLSPFASLYGNRVLSETATKLERDGTLLAALEKWRPTVLRDLARGVTELHSSLGHDYTTLLTWADEAESTVDTRTDVAAKALSDLLRPKWEEVWELWNGLFEIFRGEILEAREDALASLMERWQNPSDGNAPIFSGRDERLRSFYLDLCANLGSNRSAFYQTLKERLGQSVSDWRNAQKKWRALSALPPDQPFSETEQRLRATLLRLSAFAWGTWDEMKRRRGLLSFSDMIHFAARSIRTDGRNKGFKHIMVDEFQDTDPLQDSMIQALRAKESAKLFIVGDPKQAIYGFRHADLTLFADYIIKSRGSGAAVELDVSFRTRESLLAPLNALFAYIWKNGLGTGERMSRLKFEPLSPPEKSLPDRNLSTLPPFGLLLSVKKGRGDKDASRRLAEALAHAFARWRQEGRTVWDKKESLLRPVQWKDFAVLAPSRGKYEVLESAFENLGIPVVFERSVSYFSRGEITDVVNTLRAAAFPHDETALAGWLASPFSGIPQREAGDCVKNYAASRRTPDATLFSVIREQLPSAAERLRHLQHLGSLKGPSAVLSHLLENRTWLSAFDASKRLRIVGNLNRAASLARQYENGISPSLAGCAQWLDTALRSGQASEEPEWADEDADAVRVTTIHASKGLEYPFVAVFHTERGAGNNRGETVRPSKFMGVALSAVPDMMGRPSVDVGPEDVPAEEPRSLSWELALSSQNELEESARLFYVAATRAQDALLLCGVASENAKGARSVKNDSWLAWTLNWLAAERGCDWQDLQGPPITFAEEASDTASARSERAFDRSESALDSAANPPRPLPLPTSDGIVLSSLSATSFALFEWCPFAWRRRHRQGLDLRWEMPEDGDSAGGSELGSVAHWILARWDMDEGSLFRWLNDESVALRLPSALRDAWRASENKDALWEWLSAFSRSEEGLLLAQAMQKGVLQREGAFCATLGEAGTLRLIGATDALWRNESGFWHVRDYKITLSDNAPGELYRAQLAFYALTVKLQADRQNLPFAGVDVGLVFLREGARLGDTRAFPADSGWDMMQKQILEAARTAAQGPWIPKREHCRKCPWRSGCQLLG